MTTMNDRITALEERVAFAMWKAEADRAAPNVGRNRTAAMFAEASANERDRWLSLARAALAASRAATDCHQPDLLTAAQVPECSGRIREITEADMPNIVAHLSYECEPAGPLPNANSLMMEIVRLRNELAALDLTPAPAVEPVAMTAQDAARVLLSWWNSDCISDARVIVGVCEALRNHTEDQWQQFDAALRAIGGDA